MTAATESPAEALRLRRLARLGAVALSLRSVVVQLAVLGGQIVLARRLAPKDFGVFAIVQFAMTFLTFFGDVGLGAALIQKKTEPEEVELSSVFYVQLAIGAVVLGAGLAGAPVMRWVWPDLPEHADWVLAALALNFLFTSLRCVPGLLLERRMQFVRIAVLDAASNIVFYVTATVLALGDRGIWALVGGVVAQGATLLVLTYVMCPWRPSSSWSRAVLGPLLRFGIPFQLHFVLGMAHSAITPLCGGRLLGAGTVGLVNWSQSTAHFPLQLVNIISRISFPLYSRLQEDRAALARALERAIRICGLGTMFFVAIIFATGPRLVQVVYSDQWLPAIPLLYLYAATITVCFLTPVAATALEAIGRPGVVLRLAVVVTALVWLSVPPATWIWGVTGFVSAYVTVSVIGNLSMIFIVRHFLPDVRVVRTLVPAALGGLAAGAAGRMLLFPRIGGPFSLALVIVVLAVVFAVVTLAFDRRLWRDEVAPLLRRLWDRRERGPGAPDPDVRDGPNP